MCFGRISCITAKNKTPALAPQEREGVSNHRHLDWLLNILKHKNCVLFALCELWMESNGGFQSHTASIVGQLSMSWWRHQMETFSPLLAFERGIHRSQRPVTRSFDVFFDLYWINGWVNNREVGDLRCHRAHYDVTIMVTTSSWNKREACSKREQWPYSFYPTKHSI